MRSQSLAGNGPFNRYRALDLDHKYSKPVRGKPLTMPACFIGGEKDPVRQFVPGVDTYTMAGAACDDFRGTTIVPGVGHWVQQEAPEATNADWTHSSQNCKRGTR